jgi:DNA-directed RNA polymerase subunit beta
VGKTTREAVLDDDGNILVKARTNLTTKHLSKFNQLSPRTIKVVPFVSGQVEYLSADREDLYSIAQANARLDKSSRFAEGKVETRLGNRYMLEAPQEIDYMDVSPKQLFSVGTSLIPFLEHNDANRALMGANMQRQAVPLLRSEAPLVATGVEAEAARYGGQVIFARAAGTVTSATSSEIAITNESGGKDVYELIKYSRTNQGTCINQRSVVTKGSRVEVGQVLGDSSATEQGELALGQNLLCAFMSWEGYNYEDAIVISSRLVMDDKFSSIHIEKHETEARDTKLGPEEITRDIPNVGEESLRELDEDGIIRVGAEVRPSDILVGKITPKGETELSAEEKLLRAIFGEKAREVKDTSLRVPHGQWGKVIDVRVFSRSAGDELPAGVDQRVQVWVAQKRRISVGDKLAGRHGNKGVIALIAPVQDMPFLPDGTPIDIILNPIGVPSRMNVGQVLEAHLGWAAHTLGFKALTPVFAGATDVNIEDELARVWIVQQAGTVNVNPGDESTDVTMELIREWLKDHGYDGDRVFSDDYPREARDVCLRLWLKGLEISSEGLNTEELDQAVDKVSSERNIVSPILGKTVLRDGRTGETFEQPVTVGNVYMMKLIHLVEDKVHARSTGPYSLISQQPLGGKAQFGGQRFGEMEVWTLEGYGAARNLQEMLTVKSDDVAGRAKTYEAIIKSEDAVQAGVPESFKVLVKELQSLGLSIEVISEEEGGATAEEIKKVTRVEREVAGLAFTEELEKGPGVVAEGELQADSAEEQPGVIAEGELQADSAEEQPGVVAEGELQADSAEEQPGVVAEGELQADSAEEQPGVVAEGELQTDSAEKEGEEDA